MRLAVCWKGIKTLQNLFAYFEGLDEAVYISDVETNEIVFMNQYLRENLGYTEKDSYKGEKCYKVLQGKASPCSFCNNKMLESGKFVTWACDNPVLNQRFVVRDTIIVSDGRRYRVEVADEVNNSEIEKSVYYFTRREAVLNECLQRFFATLNPEESLKGLLNYLGEVFHGDRAYIFEIYEDHTLSNTYEWCAADVKPQKDILCDLSLSDIDYWVEIFSQGKAVEISDIEEIRNEYPTTYSLLKPQNIESLVVGAIWDDGKLKGFIGIDNPTFESISLLGQILKELGEYMAPQLKRRDLYRQFRKMSYHDLLTGAYNHNAIVEQNMNARRWKSLGVVYCDINGLKETNDTQGHDAGNRLIQECYHLLEQSLNTEWIYRIGGDEFVALYCDTEEDKIKKDVDILRMAIMQSVCQISVGYAWSDRQPIDTEQVMNRADAMMYEEKEHYYEQLSKTLAKMSTKEQVSPYFFTDKNATDYQIKLQRFLANTYFDVSFLLETLSAHNGTSYFFFGDMQKNLFFISENMREKFEFENNIVPDLIHKWASRISDPDLLKRFWDDINAVMEKKKSWHDMRYRMTDTHGNDVWLRCVGRLKWNEDGTKPLFFTGRVIQQDEDFVVDALTNFPTETVLIKRLEYIKETSQSCKAIGFAFRSMGKINNNYGRSYGDNLIREITSQLFYQLGKTLKFYRLSGMRCVALTASCSEEKTKELVSAVKAIIDESYQRQGIAFQHTSAFAVMEYPQENVSSQDFVEKMESLIKVARQFPMQLYIEDSDENIQRIQKASNLENQLIKDIINGMDNFRIVIQPIVSSQDGHPVGGETLLRWRFHDEDISPSVFIPIIENAHMIDVVGRWGVEQAVHACVRTLTYIPDFYLTVNVSLQQLNDAELTDFIHQTLLKYNLDGSHIVLELTESCMDNQPKKLDEFVEFCNDENIRIALDDFGSGYSSLRVLLRYPSSIIKLDRSLLLEMCDSHEKIGFITSIVYACHHFGKMVCMEGVETEHQNELVKEAGCDLIQGFYYYRPMEVHQVYQLIAEQHRENR